MKWDPFTLMPSMARSLEKMREKEKQNVMPPRQPNPLLTRILQCCCHELKQFLGRYVKVWKYKLSNSFSSVTNDPSAD